MKTFRIYFVVILFFLLPTSATANGWEHTAISLDALIHALTDKSVSLRLRAAQSLGFRNQKESALALINHLEGNEPSAEVRREIYHSLGQLNQQGISKSVVHCVKNENVDLVRAECIRTIGLLRDPRLEQLVIDNLNSASEVIKKSAVISLGGFSSSKVIQLLKELVRDENSVIAHLALSALGRTQSANAATVLVDALALSPEPRWVLKILQGLTQLKDQHSVNAIQQVYDQTQHPDIKRSALVAMAATNKRRSDEYFLDALSSEDILTKIQGLIVLREAGEKTSVPAILAHGQRDLKALFTKTDTALLQQADHTLQQISLLNEYLKTTIALDPASGAPLFLLAISPTNIPKTSATNLKIAEGLYQARWQSIYGSGYVHGNPDLNAAVTAAANDADARIRAVATRSLGVQENRLSLPLLHTLLMDPVAEVRWTGARVLGRLIDKTSIPLLIDALEDTSVMVRMESAISLGYISDHFDGIREQNPWKEIATGLTRLTNDDADERVRQAAQYALSLLD